MIAMRLLTAVFLFAAAFAASAQMYRWTDDKGRVHFSSTPPPAGTKNVQKKSSDGAAADSNAPALPYSVQKAQADFPITLYTTPGCEGCDAARKLLNGRGIPFKEVSVTENEQIEELKAAAGANSVPTMIVGRSVQRGFEEGNYNRTLDAAGYPRAGVLPPRTQAAPNPLQPATETPQPLAPGAPRGPYSPPG
jgi:glutaredoxin